MVRDHLAYISPISPLHLAYISLHLPYISLHLPEQVCSSLHKIEHIEDEGVDEELFTQPQPQP